MFWRRADEWLNDTAKEGFSEDKSRNGWETQQKEQGTVGEEGEMEALARRSREENEQLGELMALWESEIRPVSLHSQHHVRCVN